MTCFVESNCLKKKKKSCCKNWFSANTKHEIIFPRESEKTLYLMHHTLGKVGHEVFYFYDLLFGHLYVMILLIVLVLYGGKSEFWTLLQEYFKGLLET